MGPLPLLFSVLWVGLVARFQYLEYARLIALGSDTAATLTLAMGAGLAVLAAVFGWRLGRALQILSQPDGDKKRAGMVACSIILFTVYVGGSMASGRATALKMDALRREVLTTARAEDILAHGSTEEKAALAYNRTCPPDVLRLLALSRDEAIRRNTAANPATPPEVAAKLTTGRTEKFKVYSSMASRSKR